MKKVVITADSTCDLSAEIKQKYNIETVPLYINMGNDSYRDGVDIAPEDIFTYVSKTGVLPKTSAPTIGDYKSVFEKYRQKDCAVVHINLGSGFSAAHQNARIAAEDIPNVYVVDSKNLSSGTGLLVVEAALLSQLGLDGKQIADTISEMTGKVNASFIIDTLEYLHKGGRCSSVAALGANLLKLKPCIEVKNGAMEVGKKYKGVLGKVLPEYVDAKLNERSDLKEDRIFITHTGCSPEIVEAVKGKIKSIYPFEEILETRAGCTITSHCGPNTLGILFLTK